MKLKVVLLLIFLASSAHANVIRALSKLIRHDELGAWAFTGRTAITQEWAAEALGARLTDAAVLDADVAGLVVDRFLAAYEARRILGEVGIRPMTLDGTHGEYFGRFFGDFSEAGGRRFFRPFSPRAEGALFDAYAPADLSIGSIPELLPDGHVQVIHRIAGGTDYWVQFPRMRYPVEGVPAIGDGGIHSLFFLERQGLSVLTRRFSVPPEADSGHILYLAGGENRVRVFARKEHDVGSAAVPTTAARQLPEFRYSHDSLFVPEGSEILALGASPKKGAVDFVGLVRDGEGLALRKWEGQSPRGLPDYTSTEYAGRVQAAPGVRRPITLESLDVPEGSIILGVRFHPWERIAGGKIIQVDIAAANGAAVSRRFHFDDFSPVSGNGGF